MTIKDKANCAAWVVLRGSKPVARVAALYTKSSVTVEVWQNGEGVTHTGKASGYGYDKFTSALAGAKIGGVELFNHCGRDEKTRRLERRYHAGRITEDQANKAARRIGARWANWGHGPDGKPSDCYYQSGLDRLSDLGYTVVQAL